MVDLKQVSKADTCVKEFSIQLILLSFGISALLAFEMGKLSAGTIMRNRHASIASWDNLQDDAFPVPQLIEGKEKPDCLSTNRYFDSLGSVTSLFLDLNNGDDSNKEDRKQEAECEESDEESCSANQYENEEIMVNGDGFEDDEDHEDDDDEDDDDDEHLPAGQHLLVDVINVDKSFLSSEVRLAQAMMNIVNQSKLTLLSYHCYTHIGVSCVGVLLESHIAFHTWPEKGVITLDLFTCGSGKLVPLMPLIEKLFVVPQVLSNTLDVVKKPFINWSHKLRGFRTQEQMDYLFKDIGPSYYEVSHMAEKRQIATTTTAFQKFDVVDYFDHDELYYDSYLRSLTGDSSYESEHAELYRLDRTLFLDGVQQSSRIGIEAYHEALVHPAMFAHGNPEKVAIIGGGECATLREVLKHKDLKQVTMIEIDEHMVEMSREHLPDWSDCSDLKGSANWCGDDDRARMYYEDALAWFNDRFSKHSKTHLEEYNEDPFDILIMDALDPEDDVPFADMLYTSSEFLTTLYDALSEDGIIVFQLGASPGNDEPPQEATLNSRRAFLADSLEGVGYKSVHIYEESHARFGDPWTFLVAMKSLRYEPMWSQNMAEVNVRIHDRIIHTHSGTPALKHFDGSTMESYRIPNKVFQVAYCRKIPTPESCQNAFSVRRKDIPVSSLEVRTSDMEGGGRGVFAKVDIEEGSFIALGETQKKVHFPPTTLDIIYGLIEEDHLSQYTKSLVRVYHYVDGYGWQTMGRGQEEYFVDSGIITFVNHGCNGTYNIDDEGYTGMTEQNTDLTLFDKRAVYDPYSDRNYLQISNAPSFALRNIVAGEEILCNYLTFCEVLADFTPEMEHLKKLCNEGAVGIISVLEQAAMSS